MNVISKIREVLAEANDTQLDRFLTDVRESLATSTRQFLAYGAVLVTSLITYHLVVYGGASAVSYHAVQVSDTLLFRRVFLIFPAALITAMASVGYLRRLQREVYDYLAISRWAVLGKTGLHELRLPADHVLGLFVLRTVAGLFGRIVGNIVALLSVAAFGFGPVVYIVREAARNLQRFGTSDILCVAASGTAIVLCLCGLVIFAMSGRIKAC